MSEPAFEAIVVGLGGMGAAALCELARRGRRVLGLEQYAVGHDRGSSHGHTRIIRQAYYEHPDYVPLVQRAYRGWHDLEQRQGVHLLTECPCLSIGRPDGELVAGVLESAGRHSLPVERLENDELARRYPAFRFGPDYVGVVERTAGFLLVDDCVRALAAEAQRLGAVVRENESVVRWGAEGEGVEVETTAGRYRADRLVIAAGPWAAECLRPLAVRLTVMRQIVCWFRTKDDAAFGRDVFPTFIADTPDGAFYGLPALNADGLKCARHYGAPELQRPEEIDRTVTATDEAAVRAFLRDHLPDADGPLRRASVCIYTLTPDRHFLIDVHPQHPQVVFAAGFSGHGFKFAPVVGEILADLAETGRTEHPVGMFRLGRFRSGERGA
jgi:sarcosine oxidase